MRWYTSEVKSEKDSTFFGFWVKVSKKDYINVRNKFEAVNKHLEGYAYSLKFQDDIMNQNLYVFFEEIPENELPSIELMGKGKFSSNVRENQNLKMYEGFFEGKISWLTMQDPKNLLSKCENLFFIKNEIEKNPSE